MHAMALAHKDPVSMIVDVRDVRSEVSTPNLEIVPIDKPLGIGHMKPPPDIPLWMIVKLTALTVCGFLYFGLSPFLAGLL